jgi:hypothetical protein
MIAGLVSMSQVVVDKQILIDAPGTQLLVVLQIKKSHRHHILIFMRGMI